MQSYIHVSRFIVLRAQNNIHTTDIKCHKRRNGGDQKIPKLYGDKQTRQTNEVKQLKTPVKEKDKKIEDLEEKG